MRRTLTTLAAALALAASSPGASADPGPSMVDPSLRVRTVADGLITPVSVAHLGADDTLVTEKNTGRVRRIADGAVSTVLDLAVNFGSERGLLGTRMSPTV